MNTNTLVITTTPDEPSLSRLTVLQKHKLKLLIEAVQTKADLAGGYLEASQYEAFMEQYLAQKDEQERIAIEEGYRTGNI